MYEHIRLTDLQREYIGFYKLGMNMHDIARKRGVTAESVFKSIKSIRNKFHVYSDFQLGLQISKMDTEIEQKQNNMTDTLFSALMNLYPNGMKIFTDWLVQFKKENKELPAFLQCPYWVQVGIWIEFCVEHMQLTEWPIPDLLTFDWEVDMFSTIKSLDYDEEEAESESDND